MNTLVRQSIAEQLRALIRRNALHTAPPELLNTPEARREALRLIRAGASYRWRCEDGVRPLMHAVERDILNCGVDTQLWVEVVGGKFACAWTEQSARLFAADCAEEVLYLYEREVSEDARPRDAIRVARLYALGLASSDQLTAAREGAEDAACAARGAAWDTHACDAIEPLALRWMLDPEADWSACVLSCRRRPEGA